MTGVERKGIEGLEADLQAQRALLRDRVPVYDRLLGELLALLADDVRVRDDLAAALGARTFVAAYDRPLLILASLRHDALLEGPSHPLHQAIGAGGSDPDALSRAALKEAILRERVRESIARRYVQTNETSRAVAWRWPARLAGADGLERPLALVDIGASAGLNLVAEALPANWTDENGAPLPVASDVAIVLRQGYDARPLDPLDPDAAAWLRACIWPGDERRLGRLEEAIAAWRANPGRVDEADIAEIPARIAAVVETLPADALLLAYQTVVREYLPPQAAEIWTAGMRALLGSIPAGRLVYVELETAKTPDRDLPAAITAHLRTPAGVETLELARCHWHPSTVAVDRAAVERFVAVARPAR